MKKFLPGGGNQKTRFFDALAVVAVASRHQLDELTERVYRRALSDIPIEYIEQACATMARDIRWFPTTGDIRATAEAIMRAHTPASPPSGAASVGYACPSCKDTGWIHDGNAVEPCECRPTNPNYLATHPRKRPAWQS